MQANRRQFLITGALAGAAIAGVGTAAARSGGNDPPPGLPEPDPTSPHVDLFAVPLAVPPVLRPTIRAGIPTYRIVQRPGLAQILPGAPTPIWGYNGMYPGPTIRARAFETIHVEQVNRLPVPFTTHLHGGDTPPEFDGHPLDLTPPGSSKLYIYPNTQRAAPLWYHDHSDHATARNVYMGLAGVYTLTDEVEESLPLPHGQFDVPLCLADRLFNADNTLRYPTHHEQPEQKGVLGDILLVNGRPHPFMPVANRRYMFRVLNGSNARQYRLRLSSGDPFTVVGTDGGLMPHPVEVDALPIAPAERYMIVVDFGRHPVGRQIVLENTFGEDRTTQLMRFDVRADASDPTSIPADLRPLPDIDPANAVAARTWRFERRHGAWVINSKLFDPDRIDATPRLNSTEIWTLVNKSGGWTHPIHIHLVEYLVLDRNGKPPHPWERGLKDTVILGPNETIRIALRFDDFRGVYVMHCHNLEHEDHDMMTQFRVI
jgi:spore coat protein A